MRDIKRVVLKLSGEALAKDKGFGFDDDTIDLICENIKKARDKGLEIAIVVGGGNFWRGRSGQHIDDNLIETYLNNISYEEEYEKAYEAGLHKKESVDDKNKVYRFLASRGFSYDIIRDVLGDLFK